MPMRRIKAGRGEGIGSWNQTSQKAKKGSSANIYLLKKCSATIGVRRRQDLSDHWNSWTKCRTRKENEELRRRDNSHQGWAQVYSQKKYMYALVPEKHQLASFLKTDPLWGQYVYRCILYGSGTEYIESTSSWMNVVNQLPLELVVSYVRTHRARAGIDALQGLNPQPWNARTNPGGGARKTLAWQSAQPALASGPPTLPG